MSKFKIRRDCNTCISNYVGFAIPLLFKWRGEDPVRSYEIIPNNKKRKSMPEMTYRHNIFMVKRGNAMPRSNRMYKKW